MTATLLVSQAANSSGFMAMADPTQAAVAEADAANQSWSSPP